MFRWVKQIRTDDFISHFFPDVRDETSDDLQDRSRLKSYIVTEDVDPTRAADRLMNNNDRNTSFTPLPPLQEIRNLLPAPNLNARVTLYDHP